MRVNQISQVSFNGKIIDTHVHLGKWGNSYYGVESLDVFTKAPLKNGDTVEKMLVSNSSCIDKSGILDELAGNRQILSMASQNSKIAPIAVCQPNLTGGDAKNIEKLLTENPRKFVGLKFHPKCMELAADSNLYDQYLSLAEKHNLPCLFHTDKTYDVRYPDGSVGQRCQYSRPEQVYTLAKRHKNVPIIFAHLGGNDGDNVKAAVDIIVDSIENDTAKLYADISWVNADESYKKDIVEAIKRLKNTAKGDKTDRLLFGTDAPIGRFGNSGENGLSPFEAYSKVVEDVKNTIKIAFSENEADEIIEKIFYKNAQDLFFYKNSEDNVSILKSSKKSGKFLLPILLVAAGIVSACIFVKNKLVEKNK